MYNFVLFLSWIVHRHINNPDSLINFVTVRNCLYTLICLLMPLFVASGKDRLPGVFLSEKDGLSSDWVHCCIQDSRGFLWIGTSEGLDLYDGQLVRPFGHATYSLLEADGKIWSGTENGLWTYSIDSGEFLPFVAVTRYGVNIVSRVNALEITDGTVVWAGTDGQGVFLYNTTNGSLVQHSIQTPYVHKILPSPDGRVIVVDKEGRTTLKIVNAMPVDLVLNVQGFTGGQTFEFEGIGGQPGDKSVRKESGTEVVAENGTITIPSYTYRTYVLFNGFKKEK